MGGSVETFMSKAGSDSLSCRGVEALQMALKDLSTSADENQIVLCFIIMSVNKEVQKLTSQWLPFPMEGLLQAGLCRCCSISPVPS